MLPLDALLAACLDQPADDAARLVYADALDDTGDPANAARAELVRLQIAGVDERRQRELLTRWLPNWLPQSLASGRMLLDGWWATEWISLTVRRGFVSAVWAPTAWPGELLDDTPATVADLGSRLVADLFAENPVGHVLLMPGGGRTEEWTIERTDRWECLSSAAPKPIRCEAATRERFAGRLKTAVYYRLLAIGQNLLWRQGSPGQPTLADFDYLFQNDPPGDG